MLVLLLLGLQISDVFTCDCQQQWHRTPENGSVNIYINKTVPGRYEMLTWQWATQDKDGIWTVTLKRWPKIEYSTGTVKYKHAITKNLSYMGWKIKKNLLTWSGKQGMIFQPAWNISVCNFNKDFGFKSKPFGLWTYTIGNVTMSGDMGSTYVGENPKKTIDKIRTRRAPEEDADDVPSLDSEDSSGDKSLVKWILRKTGLDQGDNDQRDWWEKIADLVLAWFKSLLT